jgi:hypothetical protein
MIYTEYRDAIRGVCEEERKWEAACGPVTSKLLQIAVCRRADDGGHTLASRIVAKVSLKTENLDKFNP